MLREHPAVRPAHDAADQELRGRGYTPADLYVVKVSRPDRLLLQRLTEWLVPHMGAQSFGDDDRGIGFEPFDAGDGVFAANVTMWNQEASAVGAGWALFDISSPDTVTVMAGGGNLCWDLLTPPYHLCQPSAAFLNGIRSWFICSTAGCTGAAVRCARTGPLWAPCFEASCTGVGAACGVAAAGQQIVPIFQ